MIWRIGLPTLVTLAVAALVVTGWLALRHHEEQHQASLAEAESYATRSHLAKELATQFEALRAVARFWSDYGRLDPEEWDTDAQIELSHFHGFDAIVWNDPQHDIRYATTVQEEFALNRVPDQERWRTLAPLLDGFPPPNGEQVLGPTRNDDGRMSYRVRIPATGPGNSGALIARIDAFAQLEQLLSDRSPGQAIRVAWDGEVIYQRGQPGEEIPDRWIREGMIEIGVGPVWKVSHLPTAATVDAWTRPALPGLLVAGCAIALLLGGLVYATGRERSRARVAQEAQRRYSELNAELELRVRERTAALEERTMDLETINQSVSHDIRDPLSAISTGTALIGETSADPQTRETAQRMQRATAQIVEVIERLNAYSTVAFASLDREHIDMNDLVEKVVQPFRDSPRAGEAGLRFEVAQLPPCFAQPLLVEILLHNLVSNAFKHALDTGHPPPCVEIGAEAASGRCTYLVRDNGPGFDPADAEKIFKPFVRLSHSDAGQGLGLAIVERVVRRHGGNIRAESAPRQGATFAFDLGPESSGRPADLTGSD